LLIEGQGGGKWTGLSYAGTHKHLVFAKGTFK